MPWKAVALVPLLVVLVGCAQETVPPNPKVQATLVTTGKQAKPAVEAGVTQAAATKQAGGGETATPAATTAPAAGTPQPSGATGAAVQVIGATRVAGDTRIVVRNMTNRQVDLGGWVLRAGDARAPLPAGLVLAPGATVTMHTDRGEQAPTDIYLGEAAAPIIPRLAAGGQLALVDPQGQTVAEFVVP